MIGFGVIQTNHSPVFHYTGELCNTLDSRVFFIFVEHCAYWSDSWGFYEIEDFRESESNGTFFAINRLREEYKGKVYWQDSVGSIYEDSKNSGYSLGDDFEKSVRFFDGYVAPNIISTTIMKNITGIYV